MIIITINDNSLSSAAFALGFRASLAPHFLFSPDLLYLVRDKHTVFLSGGALHFHSGIKSEPV